MVNFIFFLRSSGFAGHQPFLHRSRFIFVFLLQCFISLSIISAGQRLYVNEMCYTNCRFLRKASNVNETIEMPTNLTLTIRWSVWVWPSGPISDINYRLTRTRKRQTHTSGSEIFGFVGVVLLVRRHTQQKRTKQTDRTAQHRINLYQCGTRR